MKKIDTQRMMLNILEARKRASSVTESCPVDATDSESDSDSASGDDDELSSVATCDVDLDDEWEMPPD